MHQTWNGSLNRCHPPFSLLDQVETSIEAERAEIVVVAPERARSSWFVKLRYTASRQVFLKGGMRIFEADGKAGPTS